mgnify:FL=1
MKNKKIVVIITSMILLIGGILFVNKIYNKSKNKHIPKKNNLAIMVKSESGEYQSTDAIPKGNYVLNKEKTICENNGKVLNYDSTTGKVSFSFIGSDRCSLYFDKIIDNEKPVINNLTVNDTAVTATLTDNIELSGYGISTSNSVEPTSWTSISGTSYDLSTTITTEGTYYLWVKDSSGNKTTKEFTISLGTSFETLMIANNTDIFDENGLRYEGADPNNYICLDNKTSGTCSSSSLLFRIIGLFDEDTSSDGTNSSGTKKLLKVIDTNNYGGTSGKYWNSAGTNNWSTASLKTELNGTYLTTLLGTLNVNGKLSSGIVNAKWHLGGANLSNANTLTSAGIYKEERNMSAIYSGNPSNIFAKVGLMYPSDYGYATVGGSTTNKLGCRNKSLVDWISSLYNDCKNNDWLFTSQSSFVNEVEWLLSPYSSDSSYASYLSSVGYVGLIYSEIISGYVDADLFSVRPTFYLDSSILKIVGGTGTSTNPYHIG